MTAELTAGAATLGRYVKDPNIRTEFRPPHGRFTAGTLAAAQRAGFDTVLWTDDPGDWRNVSRHGSHGSYRALRDEPGDFTAP